MFVLTEGRLTNLIAPITPYYSTGSEWLSLEDNKLSTLSEIYRTQPPVRSVVDFLAAHCARMPIKLFQRNEQGDRQHLRDSPAQKLLNVPTGHRRQGRMSFWREMWLDFLIYDRCCAVKIKNLDTGDPVALVRLPPVWFTPFGTNYWHPDYIRIIGNRGFDDFPIEDCVYIHGYDPVDPRIGVSPLATLKATLEENAAQATWRKRYWENAPQPSIVVSRPAEADEWDDESRDRFIESLRAAANRGKPLMLEEGMTTNPGNVFNPRTEQYIGSLQLTREEVLRAYNVPIGLWDPTSANFSSIGMYRNMLYSETIAPLTSRWVDELETQLLTEWYSDPYDSGVYYEAMIEERMRGNMIEQIAAVQPAVGGPWMTRKEARGIFNMPLLPDQDTDELLLPAAIYPVNQGPPVVAGPGGSTQPGDPTPKKPAAGDAQPGDQGDDGTRVDKPKRFDLKKLNDAEKAAINRAREQFVADGAKAIGEFYTRQSASALSKMGAGQEANLTGERWDRELSDVLYEHAMKVATYFGTDTADRIDGTYDEKRTEAYLRAGADAEAEHVNLRNDTTLQQSDNPKDYLNGLADRGAALSLTRTTYAMSFGIEEAARQSGHGE